MAAGSSPVKKKENATVLKLAMVRNRIYLKCEAGKTENINKRNKHK